MPHIPTPPDWAAHLRSVGVTGTNGKTSCCFWTGAALETLASPVPLITSLGAFLDRKPLDVPRSYAGMTGAIKAGYDRGARYAVIEFASWSLAQGFAEAWPCQIAIFTNVTPEHYDIHGGIEQYVASKAQLFASLPASGTAVLNAGDQYSQLMHDALRRGVAAIWYGSQSRGPFCVQPDVEAFDIRVGMSGTSFRVRGSAIGGSELSVTIRAIGAPFVENATAAIVAA